MEFAEADMTEGSLQTEEGDATRAMAAAAVAAAAATAEAGLPLLDDGGDADNSSCSGPGRSLLSGCGNRMVASGAGAGSRFEAEQSCFRLAARASPKSSKAE